MAAQKIIYQETYASKTSFRDGREEVLMHNPTLYPEGVLSRPYDVIFASEYNKNHF